jgi:hypothetical protein
VVKIAIFVALYRHISESTEIGVTDRRGFWFHAGILEAGMSPVLVASALKLFFIAIPKMAKVVLRTLNQKYQKCFS